MSFTLADPKVALPNCSSYFVVKRYRKMNTLIQVGPSSKIIKEWKMTKSEADPSICMDTESNVMDPKDVRAVVMIDGNMSMLKDEKIQNLAKPSLEFDNFVGIFDGHVLMATSKSEETFIYHLIDLSGKHPQKNITLDGKIPEKLFHCYIPCEDVSNRKYSLNGLFYGCNFFLFNRETRDFDHFKLSDESMFLSFETSSQRFEKHSNIPFREGNSVRSFFSADQRLIEVIFDKDMKSLKAIGHLPWINDIQLPIVSTEKFGIVFFGKKEVYGYRPALSSHNIHEGKYQKKKHSLFEHLRQDTALWSEELKSCLFYSDLECETVSVELDSKDWLPYWSEEEIQKEFAVKTHQMESHPNITILDKNTIRNDKSLCTFRGEQIYQIKRSARTNDFQIVRGINCKEMLPQMCSENYQEISVKEFSNYLGAPVYKGNSSEEFGYVFDVINGKVKVGSSTKYGSYRIEELPQDSSRYFSNVCNAFGIVEPRSEANQKPRVELQDDWIIKMKDHTILIESGKIKVIDFTTDRDSESSLIENVKNGIWNVSQLKLSSGVRQVLIYNSDYNVINPKISKDWETPGNIFDEDFDNFDMEIRHGWHVSAIVGLDHGIGLIDGDKYDDNSLFKNTNQESLTWTDAVCQIMAESNDPDCNMFPYGVFSTGMGDGIYPCLYKLHEGKVVAVKVAFERYGNPRFHY